MKNKSTKRALFSSVMALILCFSMLVGTTFAWFTDEVKSGTNQIVAGNLDVELYNGLDVKAPKVTEETKLFHEITYWEPGVVAYENLTVANLGNLALKYQLSVNFTDATANANGDTLAKVLKVGFVKDGIPADAGRETALAMVETWLPLESFVQEGTLAGVAEDVIDNNVYGIVIYWAPSDIDNEFNMNKDENVMSINLGVRLFATQMEAEFDSFGNDYDAGAYVTNEDFKEAVTSNEKVINVSLVEDVIYDVAAWENNAMGGEITETIIINGNGHTITFNHTNSDWNNIVTNGAKLIINNAHITNAGKNNGPWNRHDLNFACEVELNNVTSDKAMAFKAGATLNNVVISDANASDTYAIWIQPNGQTVTLNGCTIDMLACSDGRGIKIDEQYVDAPAKVTLNVSNTTFKTEEKAAIVVKSAAGADITLNNIDITNTPDPTHAVWVDEDSLASYDLVDVIGGKKAYEGDMITSAKQLQDALDAATGECTLTLGASITGNVTVTQKPDVKITIDGNGNEFNGVITVDGQSKRYETAGLTIKNFHFNGQTKGDMDAYIRLGHVNAARYTNNVTIQDCVFDGNNMVAVKSYTGGDLNVTLDGLTVNKGMHSMLQVANVEQGLKVVDCKVYSKNGINLNRTPALEMSDCEFDVTGYAIRFGVDGFTLNGGFLVENSTLASECNDGDAVIMFRGDVNATVALNNTTLEGKALIAGTTAGTEIIIDNAEVFYNTEALQAAINNSNGGEFTLGAAKFGTIVMKSNITLIGTNGAVVDCINLNGADNVALKNIEFDAAGAQMAYDGKGKQRFFANIISGGANVNGKGTRNLLIEGCTFEGAFADGGMAIAFNDQGRGTGQSGNITIKGCTFKNTGCYVDIYTYYSGYGEMIIEGNTFASECFDRPIYLGNYQSSTPVVVKGNIFEKEASFADATFLQDHSNYGVSFDAADNTFAN